MEKFQLKNILARIIAQYAGCIACREYPCYGHPRQEADNSFTVIFCDWIPPFGYTPITSGDHPRALWIPPVHAIAGIFESSRQKMIESINFDA
jgi:hypothetical protein